MSIEYQIHLDIKIVDLHLLLSVSVAEGEPPSQISSPSFETGKLSQLSSPLAKTEVCALYPPVKEKVHCSAPNSVKNLVMHRIR